MPRKGENIYKRSDGRWEGRYIKSRTASGKAIYGYVYGKSYKEAKQKREKAIYSQREARPLTVALPLQGATFGILADNWLNTIRPQVKRSTYNKYKNLISSYIVPKLGGTESWKLSADQIMNCCNELLVAGGIYGRGLSSKTVADVLAVIRRIIFYSNSCGYHFSCSGKEFSIKQTTKEMSILNHSEQDELYHFLLVHPNERNLGILLCLFTGLRLGEICALKWEDISLANGTVYIHQTLQRIQIEGDENKKTEVVITTPKSKCSVRTIPIPNNIISILAEADVSHKGYLATGTETRYLDPRTMENYFHKILKEANIKSVNFHALRHTFATRCVEVGFDIKSLSEILGHANVNITMDRYVHPSMELKRQNMERLSSLYAVL